MDATLARTRPPALPSRSLAFPKTYWSRLRLSLSQSEPSAHDDYELPPYPERTTKPNADHSRERPDGMSDCAGEKHSKKTGEPEGSPGNPQSGYLEIQLQPELDVAPLIRNSDNPGNRNDALEGLDGRDTSTLLNIEVSGVDVVVAVVEGVIELAAELQ